MNQALFEDINDEALATFDTLHSLDWKLLNPDTLPGDGTYVFQVDYEPDQYLVFRFSEDLVPGVENILKGFVKGYCPESLMVDLADLADPTEEPAKPTAVSLNLDQVFVDLLKRQGKDAFLLTRIVAALLMKHPEVADEFGIALFEEDFDVPF